MVLSGGYNLPFLNCIFERKEMRFRGVCKYINKGKFEEFYVKKKEIENSNFKISYEMLKKVDKFSNLTLIHFPRG